MKATKLILCFSSLSVGTTALMSASCVRKPDNNKNIITDDNNKNIITDDNNKNIITEEVSYEANDYLAGFEPSFVKKQLEKNANITVDQLSFFIPEIKNLLKENPYFKINFSESTFHDFVDKLDKEKLILILDLYDKENSTTIVKKVKIEIKNINVNNHNDISRHEYPARDKIVLFNGEIIIGGKVNEFGKKTSANKLAREVDVANSFKEKIDSIAQYTSVELKLDENSLYELDKTSHAHASDGEYHFYMRKYPDKADKNKFIDASYTIQGFNKHAKEELDEDEFEKNIKGEPGSQNDHAEGWDSKQSRTFAGITFTGELTELGQGVRSDWFLNHMREYRKEVKADQHKMLAELGKYIEFTGQLDEDKDMRIWLEQTHIHGFNNLHLYIGVKNKTEDTYKIFNWGINGWDNPKTINGYNFSNQAGKFDDSKYKDEEAFFTTPAKIYAELKKINTLEKQIEYLQKFTNITVDKSKMDPNQTIKLNLEESMKAYSYQNDLYELTFDLDNSNADDDKGLLTLLVKAKSKLDNSIINDKVIIANFHDGNNFPAKKSLFNGDVTINEFGINFATKSTPAKIKDDITTNFLDYDDLTEEEIKEQDEENGVVAQNFISLKNFFEFASQGRYSFLIGTKVDESKNKYYLDVKNSDFSDTKNGEIIFSFVTLDDKNQVSKEEKVTVKGFKKSIYDNDNFNKYLNGLLSVETHQTSKNKNLASELLTKLKAAKNNNEIIKTLRENYVNIESKLIFGNYEFETFTGSHVVKTLSGIDERDTLTLIFDRYEPDGKKITLAPIKIKGFNKLFKIENYYFDQSKIINVPDVENFVKNELKDKLFSTFGYKENNQITDAKLQLVSAESVDLPNEMNSRGIQTYFIKLKYENNNYSFYAMFKNEQKNANK